MTVKFKDGLMVDFLMPQKMGDPVIVSRCLPDKTNAPIGRVYQILSDSDESKVIYFPVNNKLEEIYPPTSDWSVIESSFAQYAKELAEKERNNFYVNQAERQEDIKNIRNNKNQQAITKTI